MKSERPFWILAAITVCMVVCAFLLIHKCESLKAVGNALTKELGICGEKLEACIRERDEYSRNWDYVGTEKVLLAYENTDLKKLCDQRQHLIDLLSADLNAGRLALEDLAEGRECERREMRERIAVLNEKITRLEKENAELKKRKPAVVYPCPQPVKSGKHRRHRR